MDGARADAGQSQRLAAQDRLVRRLAGALSRSGPVQCHETHISWVLVAGGCAYKFKKAVHFDFVDFSTLAARRFYCEEELRLNRRLAPELYLAVVPVTGSVDAPELQDEGGPDSSSDSSLTDTSSHGGHEPGFDGNAAAGPGAGFQRGGHLPARDWQSEGNLPSERPEADEAIEYAVKMRAFEQDALWSTRLHTGRLGREEIDQLAVLVADFHAHAPAAPPETGWGSARVQRAIADENIATIARLLRGDAHTHVLARLKEWDAAETPRMASLIDARKAAGFVRECHGDLHAGNIVTTSGKVQVFDCIEFNERMRWIDVINDIAFACMDLSARGRSDYSTRLLNAWLEESGDYAGLALLRYYLTQRALVRCKVASLRVRQHEDAATTDAAWREAADYLALAARCTDVPAPFVGVMHGFSGSGKSYLSLLLAEASGAIRLRSDVERKRLHGLAATTRGGAKLYARSASEAVYALLARRTRQIVEAGYPVIVDAAFLKRAQRDILRQAAMRLGVPFLIVDVQTSQSTMEARVAARSRAGSDASDADLAVLRRQLASDEPLAADERDLAVRVTCESGGEQEALARVLARLPRGYADAAR
ncbi:MAG TPA: AAA family ATPase [Noviherbaspirillum sp.]|nr:AAA family ATPase [Noviherbaspirillum sp.]